MPWSCYNYPAAMPDRDAGQAARRDLRRMPNPCYSYPSMCFSYPEDAPWAAPGRDTVPPPLSSLRRTPFGSCFRY